MPDDVILFENETSRFLIKWLSFVVFKCANNETKKQFRLVESVLLKCVKSQCDLKFNRYCLENNLLPNFTRLK